jgi:spermidine synthase
VALTHPGDGALELDRAQSPRRVLVGGLGVGFSLLEALKDDRVERVTVIEIEPAVVAWHKKCLAHITGQALSDDGTALIASRLAPDGVLAVWSAAQSPAYEQILRRHFGKVDVIEIPVPRGEPDVVFAATRAVSQTQGRDSDSS